MNRNESSRYKRLCNNINNLLSKGALYEWDMGHAIEELFTSQLWLKRLNLKGKPYKSFLRFLRSEFNLGDREVCRYRRIARTFNRMQVRGWRSDQLNLIANVRNPAQRQCFIKMASKCIFSEVEEEIRKLPVSALFQPLEKGVAPQLGATNPNLGNPRTGTWSLMDIQHILDDYENAYIRLDVVRGRYRVSLVQNRDILGVGSSTRLTRAVGDLKRKLEHPQQRRSA